MCAESSAGPRDDDDSSQSSSSILGKEKIAKRHLNKFMWFELLQIRNQFNNPKDYTSFLLEHLHISDNTKATMLAFLMGLKIESSRIRGLKTNFYQLDRDPRWLTRKRNYRISPNQKV